MSEIEELRAEVARLRHLLEENGIDPEPYVPPPPQFGPPTLLEHTTVAAINRLSSQLAADLLTADEFFARQSSAEPLRIRLPSDFIVTH